MGLHSPQVASPPCTEESNGEISAMSRGIIRHVSLLVGVEGVPTKTRTCSFLGSSYNLPDGGVVIALS